MKLFKILCIFLFGILIFLSFSMPFNVLRIYCSATRKIVNISIIVDVGQANDALLFLRDFHKRCNGFNKWSIVLTTGLIEQGILDNVTWVGEMKLYGELLPGLWMVQTHDNYWKKMAADNFISLWEAKVGYKPYGFFMWQPDTYMANYLNRRGVRYVQGYCFDQYAVDYMTMRGGWQQPYYASEKHCLVPKIQGKGIVVLPHLIWDWRDSFELDHDYNSRIVSVWRSFSKQNYEEAKNYVLKLMNATLEYVKPLAYFVTQDEVFGWGGAYKDFKLINYTDFFKSVLDNASKLDAVVETFNETSIWFLENFESNPAYHFVFSSPYSGKKSEWLWTSKHRVTRYDDEWVAGYVEYAKQNPDPFLNTVAQLDLSKSSCDPSSCIDTSLNFTIDDYGGGIFRAPQKGNRIRYKGNLQSFPGFYSFYAFLPSLLPASAAALLLAASLVIFRKYTPPNLRLSFRRLLFGFKRFINYNRKVLPILGFQGLLIACAVFLALGNIQTAKLLALAAYLILATEVIVHLLSYLRSNISFEE
jgi:hypothetical protein